MKQKIYKIENSIIQKKSDQLMVKDVYLQMIFFWNPQLKFCCHVKLMFNKIE
jgi:hypothetical protein